MRTKKNAADGVAVQEVTATVAVDSVVHLTVVDGEAKATYEKALRERVTFGFEAGDYKKVHVELKSDDTTANIRLSQIVMPDGSADGPWGREMDYDLPSGGFYRLIVIENMMAEDPWAGRFAIVVRLSK